MNGSFTTFDNKNSNTGNTFEMQTPVMQTDDDSVENDDLAVREDNIYKEYFLQMISQQILMNPETLMKHGHVIRKRNELKPLMLNIYLH